MKILFEELGDSNLFLLRFYMHDHIVEEVSRLCFLNLLDAPAVEHLNYVFKRLIKMTITRCGSMLEKAVEAMNSLVAIGEE